MPTLEELNLCKEIYERTKSQRQTAEELTEHLERYIGRSTVGDWLRGDIPISEHSEKVTDATQEECIEILRRMAVDHPDKFITQMFFQKEGPLANSAWKAYFGTFDEFKRQAGIKNSRHVHKLGLNIAKHASVDRLRDMNVDKRSWGDKFQKPTGKRFQTLLVASDIHDKNCDPFYRVTLLDTIVRAQPDILILNGDIFDLPEFGKYTTDPREWDVVGRMRWVHELLQDVRNAAPDIQIDFVEGNHEFRLLRHLAEATPTMRAVLSDLHGMTTPDLFGLTEFEVNYIAPADLATFTKRDIVEELSKNYKVYHDCFVAHHYPDARNWGLPGVNGHHHQYTVVTLFNPVYGSYSWTQIGGGHVRRAEYCNGEKWSNGFLLVNVDTERKRVQQTYFDVTGDFAEIAGKWYLRD